MNCIKSFVNTHNQRFSVRYLKPFLTGIFEFLSLVDQYNLQTNCFHILSLSKYYKNHQ